SCLMLGRVAEALGAYKMLLYFAPTDKETAKIVQELEAQAYEKGALVLRTDPKKEEKIPEFSVQPADSAIQGDPGLKRQQWVRRIELLQNMLQRVERYRTSVSNS